MPGAGCDIGIFPLLQPFVGGFGIFAWEPFCHRIAPRSNPQLFFVVAGLVPAIRGLL
jgi:hypothetical protein